MTSIISLLFAPLLAATPAKAGDTACPQPLHRPGAGQYLVAAHHMSDPRFRETVILLLEHSENGSLGVILNRGTTVPLEQALPKVPGIAGRRDTISNGGPVDKRVVIFLVRHTKAPPESGAVMQDLYYSASQVTLEQMLAQDKTADKLRLFSGHAGWGAGQLEAELQRGDWYLLPAQVEQVFNGADPGLWSQLMRCMPGPGLQARSPAPLLSDQALGHDLENIPRQAAATGDALQFGTHQLLADPVVAAPAA